MAVIKRQTGAVVEFEDVVAQALDGELVQARGLEIDAIRKENPLNDRQVATSTRPWIIGGQSFELRLLASGFEQIFRRPPVLCDSQSLSDAVLGGVSFDRTPFLYVASQRESRGPD